MLQHHQACIAAMLGSAAVLSLVSSCCLAELNAGSSSSSSNSIKPHEIAWLHMYLKECFFHTQTLTHAISCMLWLSACEYCQTQTHHDQLVCGETSLNLSMVFEPCCRKRSHRIS